MNVPKRLAGPMTLTQTPTTAYIAPVDGAQLRVIHVSNPSASPVDLTVSVGTDGAATRVYDDFAIPADSVWQDRINLPVANGDIVQAFASTAGVLVMTINGKSSSGRPAAGGLIFLHGDARAPRP